MGNSTEQNVYWLGPTERIVRVGPCWDRFALANDGAAATGEKIVDRPVWDFVQDAATRMWLESLIALVRLRSVSIQRPYRCDSPDMKRFMQMNIVPEDEGILRVEHSLVRCEPKSRSVWIDSFSKANSDVRVRCSICGRVRLDKEWIEPDRLSSSTSRGGIAKLAVIYGVCDDCKTLAMSLAVQD